MSIHSEPGGNDGFETEMIEEVMTAVFDGDLPRARKALDLLHAGGGQGIAERIRRAKRRARQTEMAFA